MVCTGNICRSPMAAGLLSHSLPAGLRQRVKVASAGTCALHGHPAHEHAVTAMAQIGIDIGIHRARQITREMVRGADLILVMEAAQGNLVKKLSGWSRNKARMIGEFHPQGPLEDIEDPYGATLEAFKTCIRTLQPCIEGVLLRLGDNTI